MATPEGNFVTASGVAAQTGEPFISLAYPSKDFAVSMPADDAIQLAVEILLGATAARFDAAFMRVALTHGQTLEEAAVMLAAIREAREEGQHAE